jgi:hypothetical protein
MIGGTLPDLEASAIAIKHLIEHFLKLVDLRGSLSMLGGGDSTQRALVALSMEIEGQAASLTHQAMEFHEGFFIGRLLTEDERVSEYSHGFALVVVATEAIPAGSLIDPAKVVIASNDSRQSANVMGNPADVLGRKARVGIEPGMIVTDDMVR